MSDVRTPVYLDCNATTPVDPRVLALVVHYMGVEYGNAGSRTHEYGARAKQAVQKAREQVAAVVASKPEEVIFTSGATESNNLAILGLLPHGVATNRRHIISSQGEHKAILEPLAEAYRCGFEVTFLPLTAGGYVDPDELRKAMRADTLLVSLMHVNNETGVEQPLAEYTAALADRPVFLHVDAAQGFAKRLVPLRDQRIDLISISGHKIYAPKGIGALIVRRRGYSPLPLKPLVFGGGQERGLRAGTQPVPLIAGLGEASELGLTEANERAERCREFRENALTSLSVLEIELNGDPARTLPHVLNFSVPGTDSEAVMLALKDLVAVSNGSACTSNSYGPSHVLRAMGLGDGRIAAALRFSWSHLSEPPDWGTIVSRIRGLR